MTLKEYISQYTDKYDDYTDIELRKLRSLELKGLGLKKIDPILLEFHGELDLRENEIEEIPEGVYQMSHWLLDNNKIKRIPKGFHQRGNLYLKDNLIEGIPEGFVQLDYLDISHNNIKEIPKGFIQKKGKLLCEGNPIDKVDGSLMKETYREIVKLNSKLFEERKRKEFLSSCNS